MKLRSSYSTIIIMTALPCIAALYAQGRIPDNALGAAIVISVIRLLTFCIKPVRSGKDYPGLSIIHGGCVQLKTYRTAIVFHIVVFVVWKTIGEIKLLPSLIFWGTAAAECILVCFSGGLRLVIRSTQLSVVQRVLLIMFWWLPGINYFIVRSGEKTAWEEFERETARIELDNTRAENEICKTKYPILLVHGIFFRDLNYFNYWGRIPKELIKNGAQIYYGKHRSAASVQECGEELYRRICEITDSTGCGKVNIIAHSKGGLDVRYAASLPGACERIASITTINSPHCGCNYADYLIKKLPSGVFAFISAKYNAALSRLGEKNSDFAAGVRDLTAKSCAERNSSLPLPPGVYCQSVGTYMKKLSSAGFPLNAAYVLVKFFSSAPNDGLVDVGSMRWGNDFTVFEPKTKRGISHGDIIDLFREDIPGFDVREEYVKLVEGLKLKGL